MKRIVPPSIDDIDVVLAEKKLSQFLRQAWRVVEPDPFVEGWHIDAICEHLEAVSRGEIRNLIINIPPRFTKSVTTAVMWPAWEWGPFNQPSTRWLCLSYAASLSLRDSLKCRTLIQSEWYQRRWGSRFKLMGDQNAKERYNNNKNGYRIATSVDGVATGEGGTRLLIDDPHNLKDIHSETMRQSVLEWWDTVMPTRRNDPKRSSIVIIMQRGHHEDLIGHIKEKTEKEYVWLVLPNEFEPATRCATPVLWTPPGKKDPEPFVDPRQKEGELLCPERYGREETEKLKMQLGPWAYAAQCQQRPSPAEGGILKRAWWRYYMTVPEKFDAIFQSWDMAFKNMKTSDYVSGQVWGVKGANNYLLDRVKMRLSFTETVKAVRRMVERWPDTNALFVEEKANGAAVIDTLQDEIAGIIPINPTETKIARAYAVQPQVEAGNCWLPHISLAPWVEEFVEELANFPNAPHDDDVDAFTQFMIERGKRVRHLTIPKLESLTRSNPLMRTSRF